MAVLIVPGFLRKKEFYDPLKEELEKLNFTTRILDLGYNTKGLKYATEKLRESLKNEQQDIIAHSFGGITTKYLLSCQPELKDKINSLIFVSVPHGGSWQALFLAMTPTARDLLPFRKKLKKLKNVALPKATVNFLSEKELKVWPRKGGLLKNYIDIVIPETNHDNIINSKNFISKATTFIKSGHDRVFL